MELNFSWILLCAGFNLTTRDSYFTIQVEVFTNHVLVENSYFTNHKNMVLKPAISKYFTMSYFLKHSYHWFPASSISLLSKSFMNIISYGLVNKNYKGETIIYYFIYSGARKVFWKIMQQYYMTKKCIILRDFISR